MRCSLFRRTALLVFVLAACVAFSTIAQAQRPDRPRHFAIQGVRIVPVNGPVIENGTVVMANGLITAVGKNVTIPPEAWVIDGAGLTVYPGLIDGLSSIGLPATTPRRGAGSRGAAPQRSQRPSRAARGPEDRTATTSWVNAADSIKPDGKKIATWREAGFTTAVTSPSNGIFPGQAAIINLAGDEPKDMIVRAPAALRVNLSGAGFRSYPGSLMGVIAYVRQLFLDAGHYGNAWKLYEANPSGLERPEYDRSLAPLFDTVQAGRPVLLPGNRAREILRAIKLGRELGLRTIVYGAQEGYKIPDDLKGSSSAFLINLSWPKKPKDGDPNADVPLRTWQFRERAPSTPAALQGAGIRFAFYSGDLKSPKEFFAGVRKAIKSGLASDDALRALTLSTAEIYGVDNRMGSIETGKIANVIVTDGDLFDEKTKIKFVFVDGEKFDIREKPKSAGKKDKKEESDEDDPPSSTFTATAVEGRLQ